MQSEVSARRSPIREVPGCPTRTSRSGTYGWSTVRFAAGLVEVSCGHELARPTLIRHVSDLASAPGRSPGPHARSVPQISGRAALGIVQEEESQTGLLRLGHLRPVVVHEVLAGKSLSTPSVASGDRVEVGAVAP